MKSNKFKSKNNTEFDDMVDTVEQQKTILENSNVHLSNALTQMDKINKRVKELEAKDTAAAINNV